MAVIILLERADLYLHITTKHYCPVCRPNGRNHQLTPVIPAICSNKNAYVWLSWTGEDQTLISAIILGGGCHASNAITLLKEHLCAQSASVSGQSQRTKSTTFVPLRYTRMSSCIKNWSKILKEMDFKALHACRLVERGTVWICTHIVWCICRLI